jgi:hypothetical protein
MKKNIFAVSVVALPLVLGFAVMASADNGALADFNAQYPGNSYGNSCRICHTTSLPTKNPYGTDLNEAGATKNNTPPLSEAGDDPALFLCSLSSFICDGNVILHFIPLQIMT